MGPVDASPPVVAVDVGGTSIKAGVVSADGAVSRLVRATTPPAGADGKPVVDAVVAVLDGLVAGHPARRAAAVGVVVPGIVDERAGVAVGAENLGWQNVPLRDLLSDRLGCPVVLGHDVRAGGLAEHRTGACRGARNAAFVPVGTGIAAALVLDGRLFAGDGYAGEIGHVDVGGDLPCACGGRGCLETVASAAAVARRYTAASGTRVDGSRDVAARVRAGDPAAVAVWDEALDALSRGLAMLTGIVAPEVIAVGGGFAESADLVIAPLGERLADRLTFHRVPRVVPAELGDRAGCVGAGLLAWELLS
ncbi:ROK family protein [Jiangella asiatica]|uniref:ROK family protein n=1 Tax=Jiangella asiatica TaxID=2530372 RepID=A0A4V2Z332_9ACTN|nr:ROK family protein [Jiangella asiatica]TDE10368.1 ROK family protein [Jiangella asiatica]